MADAGPGSGACPNCGTEASGDYCPACGQPQQIETPTLWEAANDVLDDFIIGVDARLPRTLKRLILRPGALTEDWLEGRRARYVRPVRLYILCSLLFFAGAIALPEIHQPADSGVRTVFETVAEGMAEGEEGEESGRAQLQAWGEAARTTGPQVLFVMMPVFALLVMGFYRKAGRSYIDHLVFSVHVHSFAFLWLALQWALVDSLPLGGLWVDGPFFLLLAGLVVYLVVALREVYGQSWVWSSLKGSFLLGVHGLLLLLVLLIVTIFYSVRVGGPRAEAGQAYDAYWEIQARFERGDTAGARALLPEAIADYRRVEAHLYDPDMRYHLGRLLLRSGEAEEAIELAREGLVEDSTHVLALGLAARAAGDLGRPERARRYYRRFLEAYGDTIAGYRARGSRHVPELQAIRDSAVRLGLSPPDSAGN